MWNNSEDGEEGGHDSHAERPGQVVEVGVGKPQAVGCEADREDEDHSDHQDPCQDQT